MDENKVKYKKIEFFCFSGTGNSKTVVNWMKETAKESGIETAFTDISTNERINIPSPTSDSLVIFISPVHGFNYPPVMVNFILNFPRGKNNVLLMNTRGGMKLWKFVTPGLTGIAFYLAALILICKGYKIKGMYPVDLPSNWQFLHPALTSKAIAYLHEKNEKKARQFILSSIKGKSYFKSLRSLPFDLLVAPVSILYYFIGRYFLAKTFYASAKCDDCGICIKNCPVKAIINVRGKPFWTFRCESCMKCMANCPQKAIEAGHGYTILMLFVFYGLLYPPVSQFIFSNITFGIAEPLVREILQAAVFLPLFALFYQALHSLRKVKIFEKLTLYTSFTKYKFWRKGYKSINQAKIIAKRN